MKPVRRPYIIVTLCVLFGVSGAAGGIDRTYVPTFSTARQAVIDRKARKFGLNPNLITAALSVEEARGESNLLRDPDIFEWAAENCGRRLAVAAGRSNRARTVFYIYAVLGKHGSSPTNRESAKRFARRAERTFRYLERKTPWKRQNHEQADGKRPRK